MPNQKSDDEYLRELSLKGLYERYPNPDSKIIERLDYELNVIKKMGYASYFIIVQDFVNWAKDHGILVGPGRGSAAGSIVSYVLKITDFCLSDF